MEYIEKIKKMLCKELDEYAMKQKISGNDLDMIWKLTDTVKNLDKIEMLEDDGGYSEARGGRGRSYMHGSSYDDDMMYSERRGRGRNGPDLCADQQCGHRTAEIVYGCDRGRVGQNV